VIERDVLVEAEIIEQPRRRSLKAHHRRLSRKSAGFNESWRSSASNQASHSFNNICSLPPSAGSSSHGGIPFRAMPTGLSANAN
jgi:hypothetical protein